MKSKKEWMSQDVSFRSSPVYWAGRNRELDFVLARGNKLIAIEVKTTAHKTRLPGIAEFSKQFPAAKKLLVGNQGIPLEEFLLTPVEAFF